MSIAISPVDSMAINLDWTTAIKEHGSKQSEELLFEQDPGGFAGVISLPARPLRNYARKAKSIIAWLLRSALDNAREFDF